MSQPVAIVLGGINGAGKTTAARSLLAEELKVATPTIGKCFRS